MSFRKVSSLRAIAFKRTLVLSTRTCSCLSPHSALRAKIQAGHSKSFASSPVVTSSGIMKALTYQSNGTIALSDRPKPTIQAQTDAIIKLTHTTICGTDLHILRGHVPTCEPGRILGHEGVGIVDTVGSSNSDLKPGDQVLISCISTCGTCQPCRRGMPSHCKTGGWILGHKIDGTQAEFVRIPHAASSLYKLPADVDPEAAVLLSDIFPTGLECGVLNGAVQPGKTVAIVGAGPVGLAALVTAQLYSPSMIVLYDIDDGRLQLGKRLGASHTIHSEKEHSLESMNLLTDGNGYDSVIEAVGIPSTFELCQQLVAPGGAIANVGVHGEKVDLHLESLWDRNITITTRLVDATSTLTLLKLVESGKINPSVLISHRFDFSDGAKAYDTFSAAAEHKALKVLLKL